MNNFIDIIMGSSFSFFDDGEDDSIEQQFDDITETVPHNEIAISIKKKKRLSARDREILENEAETERTDIRKSRCRHREKRKKTKRKRVSFNEEINNY